MLSLILIELKAFIAEQVKAPVKFLVTTGILALCLSFTFIFSAVLETIAKRSEYQLPSGDDIYSLSLVTDSSEQLQLKTQAVEHMRTLELEAFKSIILVNTINLPVIAHAQELTVSGQVMHFDVFNYVFNEADKNFKPYETERKDEVVISQSFAKQLSSKLAMPVEVGTNLQVRDKLFKIAAIAPRHFTGIGSSTPVDIWLPYHRLTFAYGLPDNINLDGNFQVPGASLYAIGDKPPAEIEAETYWFEQILASEDMLPSGASFKAIKGIHPNYNQFKNVAQLSWLNWAGSLVLLLLGIVSFFRFRLIQLTNKINVLITKIALGLDNAMVFITIMAQTLLALLVVFILAFAITALSQQWVLAQVNLGVDSINLTGLFKYVLWSIPAAAVLSYGQLKSLMPSVNQNMTVANSQRIKTSSFIINSIIAATFVSLLLFFLLIFQQFRAYQQAQYGYETDNMVVIPFKKQERTMEGLNMRGKTFMPQYINKSNALGLDIAFASSPPMRGKSLSYQNFFVPTALNGGENKVQINVNSVSSNYFDLLGVKKLQGRFHNDYVERGEAVVNESFVKRYFNGSISLPVTIYRVGFNPRENKPTRSPVDIVGVVKDYYHGSKNEVIAPMVFNTVTSPYTIDAIILKGQITDIGTVTEELFANSIVRKPDIPYILADRVKQDTLAEAARISIFLLVTLVSMSIFIVGVYTQLSQQMDGQKRELAVRFALGATNQDILYITLNSALRTFLPGSVFALLAFAGVFWLKPTWLGGITPHWGMVAVALAISALFIALSAILVYRSHRETAVCADIFSQQS